MNTRGYYDVAGKRFDYKIEALSYAKSNRLDVKWVFFDDVFSKMDWKKPLGISLNSLYRLRARQLREKYDYLVLHYSGGSDSHNILRTFVDNNIKLDEVFVKFPVKLVENLGASPDVSPSNHLSEWHYTIKPSLDWLRSHHPEVKIVVQDITDDLTKNLENLSEETFHTATGGHVFNASAFTRHTVLSPSELAVLDGSTKIASIFGASKPLIERERNKVYAYFADSMVHCAGRIDGRIAEPFYWTPDLPELVREQCHALLTYLRVNPDIRKYLFQHADLGSNVSEKFMKAVLYTTWDNNRFQTLKDYGFNLAFDSPILINDEAAIGLDKMRSMLKNMLSGIDSSQVYSKDGTPVCIKAMRSPRYFLGTISL